MIFLKIIFLLLVVEQRYETPFPSRKLIFFICRDLFKLHAVINSNGSDENSLPRTAYSLICMSDYENLFCNMTEAHWKRGQCNIAGCNIECPLFKPFQSYSDFFVWKTNTFMVKIVYEVNGTEFVTQDRPVAPYLQCHNVTRIGPNDGLFPEPDQKLNQNCYCW